MPFLTEKFKKTDPTTSDPGVRGQIKEVTLGTSEFLAISFNFMNKSGRSI